LPRVASERKKIRSPSRLFIRIRSPSSAPPPRRQFVGQRRFPGTAGTGDAEDRGETFGCGGTQLSQKISGQLAEFGAGDGPGDRGPVAGEYGGVRRSGLPQVEVAVLHHGVDHPGEAQALPVLRGEDRDTAVAEPLDLLGHDHAAATTHHADVLRSTRAQRLHQVLEVLHVAALIGRDRDAVHVLLERCVDDLLY
jgi:hypothetical protein